MDWLIYVAVFLLGTAFVSALFYFTFNPRTLASEAGEVDPMLVGRILLMIVLTAATAAAILLLGRYSVYTPPTF